MLTIWVDELEKFQPWGAEASGNHNTCWCCTRAVTSHTVCPGSTLTGAVKKDCPTALGSQGTPLEFAGSMVSVTRVKIPALSPTSIA